MERRKENPAKAFLRRYKGLCGIVESLNKAIEEAMERAFNTGVTLKEVKVLSSPAEHDPMARDVCNAVDATEVLREYMAKETAALREILTAVDSLKDEQQKQLLILRYIEGKDFNFICETMGYEKTQVFVIHGRALLEINKWMERRTLVG